MKINLFLFLFLTYIPLCWGQTNPLDQTINGQVMDDLTGSPLVGAVVIVIDSAPLIGATTDETGAFRIPAVPPGRRSLEVSYLGYEKKRLDGLMLGSGQELYLEIKLMEKANELETVEVVSRDGTVNTMGQISGRSFTAEETRRFPAGVGDPLRLATAFPGVISTDDEANEIIVRGNNPRGLLWKLEGVEIPSPNHFSAEGASSGGISMFSTQVISRSDFYTGAFAPEYGNATSGVFDIHLRKGNTEQRNYTFQAGLLGLDIAAEGPFKKGKRSSYLINYRYSTLGLLDQLGVPIQDENETNNFQDLSFKIHFPTDALGTFSLFGLGGISSFREEQMANFAEREDYDMGVLGLSNRLLFNERTALRTMLSVSGTALRDNFFRFGNAGFSEQADFSKSYQRLALTLFRKMNGRHSFLEAGITLSRLGYRFRESVMIPGNEPPLDDFNLFDEDGHSATQQAYLSWKFRMGQAWSVVSGIHYLRLSLNGEQLVEPRISLRRKIGAGQAISFGAGWHSRFESLEYYLANFIQVDGSTRQPNKDLGFTRSLHLVLGYEQLLGASTTLKAEMYYQYLFDVPIASKSEDELANSFSTLNVGEGFVNIPLVNEGTGRNYGLEVSLERKLHNGLYYLLHTTFYDATYVAADGSRRNTRFNGNFASGLIAGKEFTLGRNDNNLFGMNAKLNYSGNKRYTPIDPELSRQAGQAVRPLGGLFSERLPNYFRLDLQFSFRKNKPGRTTEWRLDIQNLTNRGNVLGEQFIHDKVEYITAFGLVPVLSYRVEW